MPEPGRQDGRAQDALATERRQPPPVMPSTSCREPSGALSLAEKISSAHDPGAIMATGTRCTRATTVSGVSCTSSVPFAHDPPCDAVSVR